MSCIGNLMCHLSFSLSQGEVRCEAPNNRLDRFTGTLTFTDQKYSLDNEKILLRGCTLRNTEWCFGLVLFGGVEDVYLTRKSQTDIDIQFQETDNLHTM